MGYPDERFEQKRFTLFYYDHSEDPPVLGTVTSRDIFVDIIADLLSADSTFYQREYCIYDQSIGQYICGRSIAALPPE